MDYIINYGILTYDKFYQKLNKIKNNANNKFKVCEHEPIGCTSCGFPIHHFSVGEGNHHITYMGGAHGNEIISVDFVLTLMENLALGKGVFSDFDDQFFTIDFIPCQNPEGFFTTTYMINSVTKDMNDNELECFARKYFLAYRESNKNVIEVNKIIHLCCQDFKIEDENEIQRYFWNLNRFRDFGCMDLIQFMAPFVSLQNIAPYILKLWNEGLGNGWVVKANKSHQEMFKESSIDFIPEKDIQHLNLKEALKKIYEGNKFPTSTLANFFANSRGVNLNDNTYNYFQELNRRIKKEKNIYANLRDNNVLKSELGPIGLASINKDIFTYEAETKSLIRYYEHLPNNYGTINCHGTGGLLYVYPYEDTIDLERNFNFYINSRLATSYISAVNQTYQDEGYQNEQYKIMNHPKNNFGVGDMFRSQYPGYFLLELSLAGGNPLGPYCDKNHNYRLTMEANMNACMAYLKTVLEVEHLYDLSYNLVYDNKGMVHYGTRVRKNR